MSETGVEKQRVSLLKNLPSIPVTMQKAMELIGNSNTTARHLAEVLETDPSLSLRVLRLVNSAMCGFSRDVQSVRHAIVLLGLKRIENVIIAASLSRNLCGSVESGQLNRYWEHSFGCAFLCRTLTRLLIKRGQDLSYMAGLLHDIGRLLMHSSYLDQYKHVIAGTVRSGQPLRVFEKKVLDLDHETVGAWAMEKWKLSPELVSIVREHHREVETPDLHYLSPVVNLADALCRCSGLSYLKEEKVDQVKDIEKPWFFLWNRYGKPAGLTVEGIQGELNRELEKIKETAKSFTKKDETAPESTGPASKYHRGKMEDPDRETVYVIDAG